MDPITRGLDTRLSDISKRSMELEAERLILVEKAMKSSNPLDVVRASAELERIFQPEDQKSYMFDFTNASGNMGYRDKPTDITYDTLRLMAKTPVIRAIIGTRQAQIANFSSVSTDDNNLGWRIRKRKKLFDGKIAGVGKEELTYSEKAKIEFITEFMINTGTPGMYKWNNDSFDVFLQKIVKDSLELDQMGFEVINNRRNELTHFVATDGGTYRFARNYMNPAESGVDKPKLIEGYPPEYVQLYQGRVYADFYPWELCMGIRNKATDVRLNGYGISELEDMIKTVTYMLNSDTYNGKFFSNGATPKGILKVSGQVNKSSLQEFRNMWQAMVTGVNNAWRTPIIESDKMEYVDLQKSNNDMQFHQWVEYLIRTACAVFKIDPVEAGFNEVGKGNGGSQYSQKQKVDYSKDKGLYPLLQFIQQKINYYIVYRIDPKFEFVFTGMSPDQEEEIIKQDISKVTNWMTVNEVRAKRGLAPIKGGDVILNAIFAQGLQQAMMGGQESNQFMAEDTGTESPYDQFNQDGQDSGANGNGAQGDEQNGGADTLFEELGVSKGQKNPMEEELVHWLNNGRPVTLTMPRNAKR